MEGFMVDLNDIGSHIQPHVLHPTCTSYIYTFKLTSYDYTQYHPHHKHCHYNIYNILSLILLQSSARMEFLTTIIYQFIDNMTHFSTIAFLATKKYMHVFSSVHSVIMNKFKTVIFLTHLQHQKFLLINVLTNQIAVNYPA